MKIVTGKFNFMEQTFSVLMKITLMKNCCLAHPASLLQIFHLDIYLWYHMPQKDGSWLSAKFSFYIKLCILMLEFPLTHSDESRAANYHKGNLVVKFCDICQFIFGYIRKGQDVYVLLLSNYFWIASDASLIKLWASWDDRSRNFYVLFGF